jgi:hypothetical protein
VHQNETRKNSNPSDNLLEQQFKATWTTLMTRTLPAPQTKKRLRGPNAPVEGGDRRKQARRQEEGKGIYWIETVQTRREASEVQRKG